MNIKFRMWDDTTCRMLSWKYLKENYPLSSLDSLGNRCIFMQFVGLNDTNNKEWYVGDIGEFDNGDRFILDMERYLEVFADYIGEPECEDQTRDLYRIENAKIVGNIYENPELLKQ